MKKETLKVGDKVRWYDPDEEARDLNVIWTICEIIGDLSEEDAIIIIANECGGYCSEAEVYQSELEKVE